MVQIMEPLYPGALNDCSELSAYLQCIFNINNGMLKLICTGLCESMFKFSGML